MGNGYPKVQPDPMAQFASWMLEVGRRLRELERPTGSQLADALKQLKQLVDNLAAQVAALASSGVVWTGPVTTSGTVNAAAGLTSAGVNANDLSAAGGGSKVVYINNTSSQLGFLTSSRRFKQDIQRSTGDLAKLRAIHVYFFRYREAVEQHPDDAYLWMGAMAEDLHDAGFTQLVEYGGDGKPFGVQMQLMWVIPHLYAEQLDQRVDELEARLAAVEAR
jgi:hypothetical protein